MNVAGIAGLLRERARLRDRDMWTRDAVLAFQARRLAEVRRYATERSPFYRELHRGLADAPLDALPIVTKTTLMERFDDLVTDRDIHFADVEGYVDTASATDRFRGHYRVAATFHGALERLPVAGWQVIDEGDRVRVLLAGAATVDAGRTADAVREALARVGARAIPVAVDLVDVIPRTALGKAPLIRHLQLAAAGN